MGMGVFFGWVAVFYECWSIFEMSRMIGVNNPMIVFVNLTFPVIACETEQKANHCLANSNHTNHFLTNFTDTITCLEISPSNHFVAIAKHPIIFLPA
jgi:hypothetical protein